MTERVVLAYSGGLDTSVGIGWLHDATGKDVVALAVDVGQGGEDFICDLAFAEFVEFEVDSVLCAADGLQVGGVEFGAVFETGDAGMAAGSIGDQAEKLNKFFGVQRRRVLVRHGIGHGGAEEVYEEACPEDGYRAHTDGG